jgi:hypothetical protein
MQRNSRNLFIKAGLCAEVMRGFPALPDMALNKRILMNPMRSEISMKVVGREPATVIATVPKANGAVNTAGDMH